MKKAEVLEALDTYFSAVTQEQFVRDLRKAGFTVIENGGRSMRTVSVEMARKLKEAGLEWKPKPLDNFVHNGCEMYVWHFDGEMVVCKLPLLYFGHRWDGTERLGLDECVWLPSLSDLMAWLEERGWCLNIGYNCCSRGLKYCDIKPVASDNFDAIKELTSGTWEDSAAKAVLWVLEQEAAQCETETT